MEGIEHNVAFVKEPFVVKSVDILRGALSQKLWDKAAKVMGISTSMLQWKGHTRFRSSIPKSPPTVLVWL